MIIVMIIVIVVVIAVVNFILLSHIVVLLPFTLVMVNEHLPIFCIQKLESSPIKPGTNRNYNILSLLLH